MNTSSKRAGMRDPDVGVSGSGTGPATGGGPAASQQQRHRRRGIRLHAEDPAGEANSRSLVVPPPSVDAVELASRRGSESDDDWDDTSEEPVLVVHTGHEGPASVDRLGRRAAAGGPTAGSPESFAEPSAPAVRPDEPASHTLAVMVGALGLAVGGTALWLTASAQVDFEQVRASLTWPVGPATLTERQGVDAAGLAELRAAVERLQQRVTALEAATDHASGAPEPTRPPTAQRADAPLFDGVWRLVLPETKQPTAVFPATELAASWSEARWPEASFRPCAPGRDGRCEGGGAAEQ